MIRNQRGQGEVAVTLLVMIFISAVCAFGLWGCPQYNVWSSSLGGKAELAHADYSRQVATVEAHAKMESAKMLAQAEVERAKGVAEANKIIGESLHGNEAYLRYLWIMSLEGQQHATIVYVPTEANLPILEAGRLK